MPVVLLLPECGVLPAVGDGGQSGANPGKTDVRQYDLTPQVYWRCVVVHFSKTILFDGSVIAEGAG